MTILDKQARLSQRYDEEFSRYVSDTQMQQPKIGRARSGR
jgi:hypothetical protein